jgi:TfoX/Sxy family transcriptional regulator of competence genes
VAYDEDLADRIREVIAVEPDLTEQRMFGGLAFLIGGNMAVAASGQGGIMVRADPHTTDALVESGDAELVEMRGRPMKGWLRVAPGRLRTEPQLARWVTLGVEHARSLPRKRR